MKSHVYSSPLSIDGTGDYGVSLPGLNFTSGVDFAASDRISSVIVTIKFKKTDGSCSTPRAGYAYHGETTYKLISPNGTEVILANDDTWTGGAVAPIAVITFSASAAAQPTGAPTNGTFLPKGGNLNDFVNEFPSGTWILQAGDDAGSDPLCIHSYKIKITTFSPLPIELLSFEANLSNSKNSTDLNWATASELDNDFFTIEKSSDLENWETITMVDGAGFSVETINYTANDNNLLNGINYYRLKQTDYNGFFTYSEIRAVKNNSNNITVSTSANNSITIQNLTDQNTSVSLYNSFGQLVNQINGQLDSDITFPNLQSGIYFVKVDELEVKKTMIL
jgi:subtilisin-like proprotein convertase family protein